MVLIYLFGFLFIILGTPLILDQFILGSYLVRQSAHDQDRLVLCVCQQGRINHFAISVM